MGKKRDALKHQRKDLLDTRSQNKQSGTLSKGVLSESATHLVTACEWYNYRTKISYTSR